VLPSEKACWCCDAILSLDSIFLSKSNAAIKSPSVAETPNRMRFQFGIASLLLITTLTAIILSIFKMAPGVGIVLSILALPALLRTIILAMQKRSRGKPMSASGKILFFFVWMGLAGVFLAVIGASAVAMFLTICFSAGSKADPTPFLAAIGIGALLLLGLLIWAFRRIVKLF
jgi:hypothetical protein